MPSSHESIGPYRVLDTLGRGGMGVVFRCRHAGTGALAAVKTLDGPGEASREALRCEALALAPLAHPGVVRIVGDGTGEPRPWYAMELVEGQSLRALMGARSVPAPTIAEGGAAGGGRSRGSAARAASSGIDRARGALRPARAATGDDLARLLGILGRLCSTLAYLHAEGVVHRDLKPENVIVRPSGEPVLVDFGIATRFPGTTGRESLLSAWHTTGTAAYIAPEQVRGRFVDARADIYAVGCMLYEALTGLPPFTGRAAARIQMAHVHQEPVAPSTFVEGVPPELEALLFRLLAKEPADRIGHAGDVADALAGFAPREPRGRGPRPGAYLYRPELAGRQPQLSRVGDRLGNLASGGAGGAVLVSGEAGSGKTRLAMEAARAAGDHGLRLILGECRPGAAAIPFQPLAGLFRAFDEHARGGGAEPPPVPACGSAALVDLAKGDARAAATARTPGAATIDALVAAAAVLARVAPLVLVIDDLHWADDGTLAFLERGLRGGGFAEGRVLVVATYAAGERPARLEGAHGVDTIALGRLSARAMESVVRDLLGLRRPPPGLAGRLARTARGNPYRAAECLRAAVDGGLLRRDGRGSWTGSGAFALDGAPRA